MDAAEGRAGRGRGRGETREVLRMRGTVSHEHPGSGQPDLYFYRDAEEIEKEEQAVAGKGVTQEEFPGEWTAPAPENLLLLDLRLQTGLQVPSVAIQQFPSEDCSAQLTTGDWTAASTAQATEQVGTATEWS